MRMPRNRRRQGAAQWLKGADRTRSPPGHRQAQRRQGGREGRESVVVKERREGRRKEGPGRGGSREEAGRRAGAPGPEGEGAALSPESALAVPGRGPAPRSTRLAGRADMRGARPCRRCQAAPPRRAQTWAASAAAGTGPAR